MADAVLTDPVRALHAVLARHTWPEGVAISSAARLEDDLGLDSLALLSVGYELEDALDVDLAADDWSLTMRTVEDIEARVRKATAR